MCASGYAFAAASAVEAAMAIKNEVTIASEEFVSLSA
jgi:hypothetical protein